MFIHFLTNAALNCQEKVRSSSVSISISGILILHKLQAFLTNIYFHPNKYKQENGDLDVKVGKTFWIITRIVVVS